MKMSLPSWECGLKSLYTCMLLLSLRVTPFVGVWIEIIIPLNAVVTPWSLPSWECGLKLLA